MATCPRPLHGCWSVLNVVGFSSSCRALFGLPSAWLSSSFAAPSCWADSLGSASSSLSLALFLPWRLEELLRFSLRLPNIRSRRVCR